VFVPGAVLQGRHSYRLAQCLGRGGNGVVFRAERISDDTEDPDLTPREVAIKILCSPAGAQSLQLLRREVSALLALRHDRIPRVYDWQQSAGYAFVVMDYYAGGSLERALECRGALDDDTAWRLLSDLLSALAVAHRASVLHLDLKPANVLLDGFGGFVLSDFGISQGALVSRAVVATGLGTLAFRAPEQLRGAHEQFDARTDLWGVGVTVWTACTGVSLRQQSGLIVLDPGEAEFGLPPICEFRMDVNPTLDALVRQMLAIDPAGRPGSAAEVLAQMRPALRQAGEQDSRLSALHGGVKDSAAAADMMSGLVDPLWASICKNEQFAKHVARFDDGEVLCQEGDESYHTFILLKGRVQVERGGRRLVLESREGTFLGEVTTLTGGRRTATLRAQGETWAAVFNAAEFERFVTCNPAVGIRLIKSLAERLARECASHVPSDHAHPSV
jgi:serine/threonine protein kinase